jgi:hypothetical protein
VFEHRRLVKVDVDKKPKDRARDPEATSCAADARGCRWVLVQAHLSQPIDDGPDPSGERPDIVDLTSLVFGTALVSPKPLEVTCDDGSPMAPQAAPRARPPAAGTP